MLINSNFPKFQKLFCGKENLIIVFVPRHSTKGALKVGAGLPGCSLPHSNRNLKKNADFVDAMI